MKDQLQLIVEDSFSEHQSRRRRWARVKSTVFAVACLCAVTTVQAVMPPPDGGYAGQNTAEGRDALFNLATGRYNTALGYHALYSETTAIYNTATGYLALQADTTGSANTATGANALRSNTTGASNTAVGQQALTLNTTGPGNTAIGHQALFNNLTGNVNTATGYFSLISNTSGGFNTANGDAALHDNTTGNRNIGLGFDGGGNLTIGSDNIDIGSAGVAGESSTIRIGECQTQTNAYMAGIFGVAVPGGIPVLIDNNCHLGTSTSSARFKEAIKPMDKASETIFSLRPVSFRYKKELESQGGPHFGLVAEDVEKVDRSLVVYDGLGKPYTVRYNAVNAMLLNEFLKAHRKIEEQEATITELKSGLKALTATVEKQAAQIQKVSEQLVVNKLPPTIAANN